MKVIAALLLGLISSVFTQETDTDSLVLEFESPDSADVAEGDDAQSYNGLIIQVRQGTDQSPTIALGSDLDDYDDVYCLNFVGFFQASAYDLTTSTSGDYTEIDDTRFDLADATCTTQKEDDTVFTIQCTNIGDATLFLTFSFTEDEQGDFGLEYIIKLEGYVLDDAATNLVMVQSLDECGDLVDLDSEDTEDTEDTNETDIDDNDDTDTTDDNDDNDDTIVSEGGRRLLQDEFTSTDSGEDGTDVESELDDEETDEETEDTESTDEESLDEEEGVSDDDSGEFDTGFARFVVNAQALDSCDNGDGTSDDTSIDSQLVFQKDDDELHIVFGRFDCTLVLDPFYGLDNSKYETVYGDESTPATTKDNAHSFGIFIASFIGLIAYLW